eukprot:7830639-Pyramimonas_sp.AAC.1
MGTAAAAGMVPPPPGDPPGTAGIGGVNAPRREKNWCSICPRTVGSCTTCPTACLKIPAYMSPVGVAGEGP